MWDKPLCWKMVRQMWKTEYGVSFIRSNIRVSMSNKGKSVLDCLLGSVEAILSELDDTRINLVG